MVNSLALRNDNTGFTPIYSPFGEDSRTKDVLQLIYIHLRAHDLVQLASTNHRLYTQIYSDSSLWDFLLQKCFPTLHVNVDLKGPLEVYKHLTAVRHNMRAGKYQLQTITAHQGRIDGLLIHDGQLISASGDRTIKSWDLKSGKQLKMLTGHQDWVNAILIYGQELISASDDGTIKIWGLESGEELCTLEGHQGGVDVILVHGDKLISAATDHTIKIWDLKHREELVTLVGHQKPINRILMHGDKLISASVDSTIKIWNIDSEKKEQTLIGHQGPVHNILIDGQQLISVSDDRTIKIWDLINGDELQTFSGHTATIWDVLMNGDQLISASSDCTIKIWDRKSGKALQTLEGHQDWVNNVLVYGNQLISTSGDSTIKIWDLENGIELQTLADHQSCVRHILMDGDKIISTSQDGAIKIWDFGVSASRLHSLFTALGMNIKECYGMLKCTPDFLQKTGIQSFADVEALGLKISPVQHLQIIAEEVTDDHNLLQTRAFAKKNGVMSRLQTLLSGVHQRLKETKDCSVLLYEKKSPWINLRDELASYQIAVEENCQSPRVILKKFTSESYAELVEDVNALIDRFYAINREHQIALLRAYVSQPGLLKAWDALHLQGINSLAELLEHPDLAPKDLFAMKK